MRVLLVCFSVVLLAFGARAETIQPLPQLAGVVIINLGAIEREAEGRIAPETVQEFAPNVGQVSKSRSVKRARPARRRKARRLAPRGKTVRTGSRAKKRAKTSKWRQKLLFN